MINNKWSKNFHNRPHRREGVDFSWEDDVIWGTVKFRPVGSIAVCCSSCYSDKNCCLSYVTSAAVSLLSGHLTREKPLISC